MSQTSTNTSNDWVEVEGSSSIAALKFYPNSNQMDVRFQSGRTYRYSHVTEDIYTAIRDDADSVGKRFNVEVRSKPEQFPYVELKS